MIIKLSCNLDFDFGIESVSIITDKSQLVKRASVLDYLPYERTKGQTDLHIIALGSYEGTGFNRNGDMFKEAECIKNVHYFVDSGKKDKNGKYDGRSVHRHHKNKPTDKKYGNIKAAAYNKKMRRIEQIVALDDDLCGDILDEQEKKGQTNWSMASKQAYDICTWCDHKAYTDTDRCDCIKKGRMGEINKEGKMCGMENPDPRWFEQSYVKRGADRIGLSLGVLNKSACMKVASASTLFSLYPDFYVPEYVDDTAVKISKKASDKRMLLRKLAEIEKHVDGISRGSLKDSKDKFIAQHGSKLNASPELSDSTIDELRKFENPSKLLKVLADKGIVFGPAEFVKYLFGDRVAPKHIEGMKSHLPDIFEEIESDDNAKGEAVNQEKFEPCGSGIPSELKNLVEGLVGGHSLFGAPAHSRVIRITILGGSPRKLEAAPDKEERSKEAFDKELAKVYASYKIATLNYLDENNRLDDETIINAVLQNRK